MDVFKKGVIAAFPAVMRWRRMQCCCSFGRCYGNPASLSMLGQEHTQMRPPCGLDRDTSTTPCVFVHSRVRLFRLSCSIGPGSGRHYWYSSSEGCRGKRGLSLTASLVGLNHVRCSPPNGVFAGNVCLLLCIHIANVPLS